MDGQSINNLNRKNRMVLFTEFDIYYLLFLGFAIHMTWTIAKRHGISKTIDHLTKEGLLELDED